MDYLFTTREEEESGIIHQINPWQKSTAPFLKWIGKIPQIDTTPSDTTPAQGSSTRMTLSKTDPLFPKINLQKKKTQVFFSFLVVDVDVASIPTSFLRSFALVVMNKRQ
jgi:hypothetical protein